MTLTIIHFVIGIVVQMLETGSQISKMFGVVFSILSPF
jgi:hypothetical protein